MFRIIAVFLALISPAFTQVATPAESLQEQLVPESFKLSGSAIATRPYAEWWTTVPYTLVNDSGMNLYMGLLHPKRLVDGDPCQVASWNENIEQRFDLGIISENMSHNNSHNCCLRPHESPHF
jgi:hypothetical protein